MGRDYKNRDDITDYQIEVTLEHLEKTCGSEKTAQQVTYYDFDDFLPIAPCEIEPDGNYPDWHFSDEFKRLNTITHNYAPCGCQEAKTVITVVSVRLVVTKCAGFDLDRYTKAYEKAMGWVKI